MSGKRRKSDDDEFVPAADDDPDYRSSRADNFAKNKGKAKAGAAKRKGKAGDSAGARGKRKISSSRDEILEFEEEGDTDVMRFLDFKELELKRDHEKRPIWVCPDGHIFLEASSPIYVPAYDFLVAIAEPVARPEFVHEYKLTAYSLYAAVAVAIDTESIIKVLNRLSKTVVPEVVNQFIRDRTVRYGKAKLVLKKGKYYVESPHPEVLRALLQDREIELARVKDDDEEEAGNQGGEFIQTEAAQEMLANLEFKTLAEDEDEDDDQDIDVQKGTQPGARLQNVSFMVSSAKVESVKRASLLMDYPLMEEYDFRHDMTNATVPMDLKPTTKIREYQEKSLSKMFGNGRARSGIIVLPCGAGKTLTGVTAASTIKKSTLVLCTSGVSVAQWKSQFKLWTDIQDKHISCFTSDTKDPIDPHASVLITTYSMLSFSGKRAADVDIIIQQIKAREWGLMLLDEVHVVPAAMFRKVLSICNAHCKLGLTATLVREDDLIEQLNFLIGPKLYEANWMDLTASGYLANVQCVEVWCPMTAAFYGEYLRESVNHRKRELLYVMNPNKFRACEFLKQLHEMRGDKIIIFADNVFALKAYSRLLGIPYIYGNTKDSERQNVLQCFKTSSVVNCIGLSKVGDTSIDIPEANVIIQISSHFGSRRQEAQRLGRILRPKANMVNDSGFNAFFYTLVSTGTSEMYFSAKRQQYLVDQGYTFKVVTELIDKAASTAGSKLKDKSAELDLLAMVLNSDIDKDDDEEDEALQRNTEDDIRDLSLGRPKVKRRIGDMSALSGATGNYMEFNSTDKVIAQEKAAKTKNALFKMRYNKKA